jgi:hypothetical protein
MDNKNLDEVLISIFKGPNCILAKIQLKFRVTVLHISNSKFSCYFEKVAAWLMPVNLPCACILKWKTDLSQAEAVADLFRHR